MKIPEIIQEFLTENVLALKERNVVLVKMQLLDVLHHLFQPCRNGKAAAIRNVPEKHVKVSDFLLEALLQIAVAHGQLIKVAEHG